MSEQMREEFEAWASKGFGLVRGHFVRAEDEYENFPTQCYWEVWQAARKPVPALIETLRENGDLIAAQATIAQQAQMIEHLRGGPTPLYTAVDMANAAADGFRDGVESKSEPCDGCFMAEAEALRKDAERYRWLKLNSSVMFKKTANYTTELGRINTIYPAASELDLAVDSAMSKED